MRTASYLKWLQVVTLVLLVSVSCYSAPREKSFVIGFYNVENLFDTVDDPNTNDQEFLPEGKNHWTEDKYRMKVHNMAQAIRAMRDENGVFHTILGLAEVENRSVVEDLVKDPQIAEADYRIVHFDSPDARGIDVAFLYRADNFKFLESELIPFTVKGTGVKLDSSPESLKNFRTRDILMIHGTIAGEHFAFYVAHLPSRIGNKGSDLRSVGADIIYRHSRMMEERYPGIKVAVMGDMNDNPGDESQKIWLHGKAEISQLGKDDFFDPFEAVHATGIGSEEYRGEWNIFDIIQVNSNLANPKKGLRIKRIPGKEFYGEIFNRPFLTQQDGKFKGSPFRSFSYGNFINGYSDHYPTFIIIGK